MCMMKLVMLGHPSLRVAVQLTSGLKKQLRSAPGRESPTQTWLLVSIDDLQAGKGHPLRLTNRAFSTLQ